jgi:Ca2+-binding EF-hand superfamily protein
MRAVGTRWLPAFAVALALSAPPARAQTVKPQPEPTPAEAWVITHISTFHARTMIAELLYQLQTVFLAADMDGDGRITQKDHDLALAVAWGRARGEPMMPWASWDLDGDGRVTREEIIIAHRRHTAGPVQIGGAPVMPTAAQRKEATDRFVDKAMEPDSDGDGVITFDEIRVHANKRASQGRYHELRIPSNALDTNGDGAIETAEYMEVVARVLARIDANGDGRLDAEEYEALRALRQAAQSVTRRR